MFSFRSREDRIRDSIIATKVHARKLHARHKRSNRTATKLIANARRQIKAGRQKQGESYLRQSVLTQEVADRYLNAASRTEAIVLKAECALEQGRMGAQLSESVGYIADELMDPEVLSDIERLEGILDDVDVAAGTIESVLDGANATENNRADDRVSELAQQIADEEALGNEYPQVAPSGAIGDSSTTSDLEARLRALRA